MLLGHLGMMLFQYLEGSISMTHTVQYLRRRLQQHQPSSSGTTTIDKTGVLHMYKCTKEGGKLPQGYPQGY
jgi:hypothetical protein